MLSGVTSVQLPYATRSSMAGLVPLLFRLRICPLPPCKVDKDAADRLLTGRVSDEREPAASKQQGMRYKSSLIMNQGTKRIVYYEDSYYQALHSHY